MKIRRKWGNPMHTGAGHVARSIGGFYYLVSDKRGTYWAGAYETAIEAFRAMRLETIDT